MFEVSLSSLFGIYPWLPWAGLVVVGLICGSFAACFAYRLPVMLEQYWHKAAVETLNPEAEYDDDEHITMVRPRSFCPHCREQINLLYLIPLLGFFFARGRCSKCKERISPVYPVIELATAVVLCWVYAVFGLSLQTLFASVLAVGLIVLFVIDARTHMLPDLLVMPLMWLGLLVNYFGYFVDFDLAFWGVIVGYVFFSFLYWLFYWLTGRESLGRGDLKLLAMLAGWSGVESIPGIVFAASFAGIGWLLVRKLVNREAITAPMAFGPFLIVAGWLSLLYGSDWLIDTSLFAALWYQL